MRGAVPRICAELVRAGADRNAGDADARHHHFAGGQLAELEELLQDLARLRAQRALLLGLLDDELQLLGRVVPGPRCAPRGGCRTAAGSRCRCR